MVTVTVHYHTILQQSSPDGIITQVEMQIPDGSTIGDLITQLALPISLEALLVVVDNKIASLDQLLRSNDQINLMPALSGG